MFLDLSECRSVRRSRRCQPEKCSWTYPEFAPLVGHTLHTGRIFLDLSQTHVGSRPQFCEPEKCSWSYLGTRSLLKAFCRMTLVETAVVSACCGFCQSRRNCA